ncbi:MAG: glycosyltransferase family 4 protein [Rudaea sp.]
MRVAFDLSSTRGRKTGIGIYTENLVGALRAFAHGVDILELGDGASADQRTDARILREQFVLPRLARRSGADLLHLTGFAGPFRAPCPVILNAHDLIGALFPENFPPASRLYWGRYLPFSLRFATRLIVLSEQTRRDVIRIAGVPAERIAVIAPGRDERFRPIADRARLEETRRRLGLPAEFILFVSTLEPRKGIDTLIGAFSQIASQTGHDLVLAGRKGWYAEQFAAQVRRLGLEKRVHFAEYVAAEDLPRIYNMASVFVLPSRYEGFGLPVLEALSCGTPVICSNASSLPEVVGTAGILVPPGDISGFAEAILGVLNDAEQSAGLRTRGLSRASEFSWSRAAEQTAELYRSVQEQRDAHHR